MLGTVMSPTHHVTAACMQKVVAHGFDSKQRFHQSVLCTECEREQVALKGHSPVKGGGHEK